MRKSGTRLLRLKAQDPSIRQPCLALKWSKPILDYHKINMGAAIGENREGVVAGVIRNEDGDYIAALSKNISRHKHPPPTVGGNEACYSSIDWKGPG